MNLHELPPNAQRLPDAARTSWAIGAAVGAAIPSIIVGVVTAVLASNDLTGPSRAGLAATVILLALGLAAVVVLPRIRHRYTFFIVDEDQVTIQQGAIFIRRIVVPFARVQNIETSHGPLDRKLGLVNLLIHTAASPVHLANLSAETGATIRDEMLRRVKLVRDELSG